LGAYLKSISIPPTVMVYGNSSVNLLIFDDPLIHAWEVPSIALIG